MTIDPFTAALVVGAVGGAAQSVTQAVVDLARGLFTSADGGEYSEQALATAQANAANLITDLTARVQRIEDEQQDEETKQSIRETLADPDFSYLVRDALAGAARTSDLEKIGMLARLVSERLLIGGETVLALATRQAVETIPLLTVRQLRILGLVVTVERIRPQSAPPINTEEGRAFWIEWWRAALSESLPLGSTPTLVDGEHLAATGCASYTPFMGRGTAADFVVHMMEPADQASPVVAQILEEPQGKLLVEAWADPVPNLQLTTVGALIGTHVHDERAGQRTRFDWD